MSQDQKDSESIKKKRLPANPSSRLKWEREQRGWSQETLAESLGTSQVNVSRWETGQSLPGPFYRRALSELFGKSVQELGLITEEAIKVSSATSKTHLNTKAMWKMLPVFTSFIGREQEASNICNLLERSDVRLVTLLGPPGVGKTRLSVYVAEKMRYYFEDGACFIEPIRDLDLVLSTIAKSLGIRESGIMSLAELVIENLREKHFLLLLDSFEQIVMSSSFEEVLVPFLEELLEKCPDLKIMVTSRIVLYLQAEHIYQVHPLKLPDMKNLPELKELSEIASVALFIQRAQAIQSDFQMTEVNARPIAEICTQLDGLPLAIELAAALSRLFPPQALLSRLKQLPQSLHLLKSEAGPLPRRQRTLYQTINWSYDLLNEQEQWLFRHLSVFSGGCTLEAVEFLVTQLQQQTIDILNILSSLIDKSLLSQTEHDREPRFTMLEIIREYGWDRLRQQGELETYEAYVSFYTSLVANAGKYLTGAQQVEWLLRLDSDLENLRTALTWLIEHEKTEAALQFVDVFGKFCGLRGYWSEELRWLQSVLQLPHTSNFQGILARVLRRAGHLAYRLRNLEMARNWQEESVKLSRAMGDKQNLAGALSGLAWTRYRLDNSASVAPLLAESVEMARESKDDWALANALESQGRFMLIQGNTDEALSLVEHSVALARKEGDKESLARILTTLVSVEIARGNLANAQVLASESFTLAQELGTKPLIALILEHRGNIALFQGDYQQATDLFEERLSLASKLDDKQAIAKNQLLLGEIALTQDDLIYAQDLIQKAIGFFRKQEDNANIALSLNLLGSIKLAQGLLNESKQLYREALKLDKKGIKRSIGKYLIGLAMVALYQKQPEIAARLCGAASSRINSAVDMHPIQRKSYHNVIKQLCTQLGENRFKELLHSGTDMSIEEILEYTIHDLETY